MGASGRQGARATRQKVVQRDASGDAIPDGGAGPAQARRQLGDPCR
jgi:hypothetical protein